MNSQTSRAGWIAVVIVALGVTSAAFGFSMVSENENLASLVMGGALVAGGTVVVSVGLLCSALVALRSSDSAKAKVVNMHDVNLRQREEPMPTAADYEWTPDGYKLKNA